MSTPSTTIPKSTGPEPDELWTVDVVSPPNWSSQFLVRTGFSTSISSALTDAEQRRGLVTRPLRGVSSVLGARGRDEVLRLESQLMTHAFARCLVPIWPDAQIVEPTNATTVPLKVSDRRIEVGTRLLVYRLEDRDQRAMVEVTAVSASPTSDPLSESVTVTTLPFNLRTGRLRFVPVIEARATLQSSMDLLTDEAANSVFDAVETPGPWQNSPVIEAGSATDLQDVNKTLNRPFTVAFGYPVADFRPEYSEGVTIGIQQSGQHAASGQSSKLTRYGRPRISYGFTVRHPDRRSVWRMKQLFEYAAGRLHPFWVLSPTPLTPQIASGDIVGFTTKAAEYFLEQWMSHVAWAKDGVVNIGRVFFSSASDTGLITRVEDENGTSVSFPSDWQDHQWFIPRLCRFISDELLEQWYSDHVADTPLSVVEVINEGDVVIGGVGGYNSVEVDDPAGQIAGLTTFYDPEQCEIIL